MRGTYSLLSPPPAFWGHVWKSRWASLCLSQRGPERPQLRSCTLGLQTFLLITPVGGQGLKLGPCPNFFKGTPRFISVRLYTNDLIICNHQGTGAALKLSAFAEKYQEHVSDSAFEATLGPGKQESAAPSYKIRKASGVWKENQMRRRWCLPAGTAHCWQQSTKQHPSESQGGDNLRREDTLEVPRRNWCPSISFTWHAYH
ncbi:uncharacterized protein LOC123327714 isoform X2 [Bubalus bubalis]|uniref:uncharacterized protein LOC123327714 isoform X2 n=1 Tax=Bubalus bubalis TaxID=89462 RepID=UPI001D123A98|nr:uncharacterized protein LOC123327714 isoform X2 [Bubalus bubalis]